MRSADEIQQPKSFSWDGGDPRGGSRRDDLKGRIVEEEAALETGEQGGEGGVGIGPRKDMVGEKYHLKI